MSPLMWEAVYCAFVLRPGKEMGGVYFEESVAAVNDGRCRVGNYAASV